MNTIQQSFIMIKHDGVQRSLVGEIIKRFEQAGLKIIGMKMIIPDKERALKHYDKDDAWCEVCGARMIKKMEEEGTAPEKTAVEYGRDIVNGLIKYITSGPVVQMVLEGSHAVPVVKKLVGSTEPLTSDVGTIRGDFTIDSYELSNMMGRSTRNLIHCTGAPEESEFEVNLWFNENELIKYRHISEAMLKDVNIDGYLE